MIIESDLKVGDIIYLQEDQNPDWTTFFIKMLKSKTCTISRISIHTIYILDNNGIYGRAGLEYDGGKKEMLKHCHIYIPYITISKSRFELIDI